jgi:hypothetical protein
MHDLRNNRTNNFHNIKIYTKLIYTEIIFLLSMAAKNLYPKTEYRFKEGVDALIDFTSWVSFW